jgi:Pyruvate/2-oxoacid:ferredoxin oxidoreductase gamma subunit
LGVIIALAGPVGFESMEKAIRQSLHGAVEKNLEAVRFGMQLAGHSPRPAAATDAPGKRAQSV